MIGTSIDQNRVTYTHFFLFGRTRMRLSSSGRMSSGYPRWVIVLLVIVVACMALSVDAAKEKRGRKRKQALEPMDNETGSNNELGMMRSRTVLVA